MGEALTGPGVTKTPYLRQWRDTFTLDITGGCFPSTGMVADEGQVGKWRGVMYVPKPLTQTRVALNKGPKIMPCLESAAKLG